VIIDTLTRFYSLPLLLHKLDLAKSSYYYCKKVQSLSLKYTFESSLIQKIFKDNYQCYGYRRIKTELNRQGVVISEKIVRSIMKSNGLKVISACKRAYSSYKGEISPEVPNLLKRNFKAAKPNEKWLTDISEFAIPAGKVYLSAIIDCYDGLAVSWNIDPHPDANLVNTTLDRAVETLNNERPIVHSDRGCHYRWPGWIDRTKTFELTRSMSKKGCSPDNSACEGFFGRMKNECFYNHSFKDYTLRMFIDYLNGYVKWYNEKRIKNSLGFCSPMEFRQMNGYAI
jgi:transposase InsO family protein